MRSLAPTIGRLIFCAVCCLSVTGHAAVSSEAQSPWIDGKPAVTAQLVVSQPTLLRGGEANIGVRLTLAPGWHIYWYEPGDAGYPTQVEFSAGDLAFGPLLWPAPETFREEDGVTTYGYRGQTLLMSHASISDSASDDVIVRAEARYLACNVTCSPGQVSLSRTLHVANDALPRQDEPGLDSEEALFLTPAALAARPAAQKKAASPAAQDKKVSGPSSPPPPQAAASPRADSGALAVAEALFLAFVGGLILNLMPCVLPVLALKVVSLASHTARPNRHRDAAAYAGGVVGSLFVLALVTLSLRALGQQVGWGFQFQEPRFVMTLAVVVLLFALNCFGVFEVVAPASAAASLSKPRAGAYGQVAEGVLAVVLATPCSAPFLGTATAFAFSASAGVVVAIFVAIGLGLALPYVALTLLPGAGRLLPKPGRWMLDLKVALGFALLATLLWLVWIVARQVGIDATAKLGALLWGLAVGARLLGRATEARMQWAMPGLVSLCLFGAAGAVQIGAPEVASTHGAASSESSELAYSARGLNELLAAGRPVFVDFTADWCITCKYNERHVLADDAVQKDFRDRHVVVMRADFTRRDPEIAALLTAQGRTGVPMYLLYDPRQPASPRRLPEILTVPLLRGALGELAL